MTEEDSSKLDIVLGICALSGSVAKSMKSVSDGRIKVGALLVAMEEILQGAPDEARKAVLMIVYEWVVALAEKYGVQNLPTSQVH